MNIGISTVIVNSPYYDMNPISSRDFWNICGRAGRAYSDAEGKILYAIDISKSRTAWQVRKDKQLAESYFRNNTIDDVQSGLAVVLRYICDVATKVGVAFDRLLELIANDFALNEFDARDILKLKGVFDLIDDELLAMHLDFATSLDNLDWVESLFKKSLAVIQASAEEKTTFLALLSARTEGIVSRIKNTEERRRIVSTGIPFSVAQAIISDKDELRDFGEKFIEARLNGTLTSALLAEFIADIEKWVTENAFALLDGNQLSQSTLNEIREDWLSGIELAAIIEKNSDAGKAVKDYYGFTLPWILHAISRVFDESEDENMVKAFSIMAMLVELGLPNEIAANIFLAGVRSRSAAVELSSLDCLSNKSVLEVKFVLIAMSESDIGAFSESTQQWLKGVISDYKSLRVKRLSFPRFKVDVDANGIKELLVREYRGAYYLITPDGDYQIEIELNGIPFDKIANRRNLYFTLEEDEWVLKSFNPRASVSTE